MEQSIVSINGINFTLILLCVLFDTLLRKPKLLVVNHLDGYWENLFHWVKILMFGVRGGILVFFVDCYSRFLAFVLDKSSFPTNLHVIWLVGSLLAVVVPTLVLFPWVLKLRNFLLEKRPWLEYLGQVVLIVIASYAVVFGLKLLIRY